MRQELALPAPRRDGPVSVESALDRRRSVREFTPTRLTPAELGQLLWASVGVNRPDGSRTVPSAGARYPLEVYVVAGRVAAVDAGVYRYEPGRHALVRVLEGDWRGRVGAVAAGQGWLSRAPALIVIGAVFGRTTDRYGERGERYVHAEVGHAAQNVAIQAVALSLGTVVVGAFDEGAVRRLLHMHEAEHPLCLMPVGREGPLASEGAAAATT